MDDSTRPIVPSFSPFTIIRIICEGVERRSRSWVSPVLREKTPSLLHISEVNIVLLLPFIPLKYTHTYLHTCVRGAWLLRVRYLNLGFWFWQLHPHEHNPDALIRLQKIDSPPSTLSPLCSPLLYFPSVSLHYQTTQRRTPFPLAFVIIMKNRFIPSFSMENKTELTIANKKKSDRKNAFGLFFRPDWNNGTVYLTIIIFLLRKARQRVRNVISIHRLVCTLPVFSKWR